MAEKRSGPGCCVLPSGRVAVVGGAGDDDRGRSGGEAFDPEARTWQPLPPMAHERWQHGLVAVAGGLLAVGGALTDEDEDEDVVVPDELFDEASGRWFELPHALAEQRLSCGLVSLPASALAAAPAGAAAAP